MYKGAPGQPFPYSRPHTWRPGQADLPWHQVPRLGTTDQSGVLGRRHTLRCSDVNHGLGSTECVESLQAHSRILDAQCQRLAIVNVNIPGDLVVTGDVLISSRCQRGNYGQGFTSGVFWNGAGYQVLPQRKLFGSRVCSKRCHFAWPSANV